MLNSTMLLALLPNSGIIMYDKALVVKVYNTLPNSCKTLLKLL